MGAIIAIQLTRMSGINHMLQARKNGISKKKKPERMALVSDAWHFRRTTSEDDTIVIDVAFISCNTICKDLMAIFERISSLN